MWSWNLCPVNAVVRVNKSRGRWQVVPHECSPTRGTRKIPSAWRRRPGTRAVLRGAEQSSLALGQTDRRSSLLASKPISIRLEKRTQWRISVLKVKIPFANGHQTFGPLHHFDRKTYVSFRVCPPQFQIELQRFFSFPRASRNSHISVESR